jgi:hypothetical protein
MGFLKRSKGGSTGTATSGEGPSFGHAAFDPADVEDARRGRPAVSLEPFAAAHGLQFLGSSIIGSFLSGQPTWPDYTFNTSRGAFPDGHFGAIGHELLELEAVEGSVRAGGPLYDVRVVTRRSASSFVGIERDRPNEPFAANAVWVPTTAVHVRAPETARLPSITIKRAVMQGLLADPVLDAYGLPGYMMPGGCTLDPAVIAAAAGACGPLLGQRGDPYVRLHVGYGVVSLVVNGFRAEDADLLHLVRCAEGIADQLTAVAGPADPTPFDVAGPPAGEGPRTVGVPLPHPLLVNAYAVAAQEYGMFNEDHTHLLAIAPRCPIPGVPSGVLFGRFRGTAVTCRVTWHEQGGRSSGTVRGGGVFPAPPGAATPLGGVLDAATDVYSEVVDGLTYCWRRVRSAGTTEIAELIPALESTLRANGLVAL